MIFLLKRRYMQSSMVDPSRINIIMFLGFSWMEQLMHTVEFIVVEFIVVMIIFSKFERKK